MTARTARPIARTARRAVLLGLAGLLVAAAHASAATVVPAPGGIAVTDPRGAADDLVIGFPAPETVRVHSAAGPLVLHPRIAAGTGGVACTRVGAATAVCRPDDATAGMRLDIRAGAGDDRVRFTRPSTAPGGVLAPRVNGGAGDDTLIADGLIEGGDGDDILRVVAGARTAALLGGAGDDLLVGGRGRDVLMGGGGSDRLVDRSAGNRFVGGPGRDLALIGRVVRASSASLDAGGSQEPPAPAADVIVGVETVRS